MDASKTAKQKLLAPGGMGDEAQAHPARMAKDTPQGGCSANLYDDDVQLAKTATKTFPPKVNSSAPKPLSSRQKKAKASTGGVATASVMARPAKAAKPSDGQNAGDPLWNKQSP